MKSLFQTKPMHKINLILCMCIIILNFNATAQTSVNDEVKISGAMKNVMHKGQLYGTISLDTISNKNHLFGIGPLEYLSGEIMIFDGKSYISKVTADGIMQVEESWKAKAPFFVYANVDSWKEHTLPDSVTNLVQLENYLDAVSKNFKRPFAFKVSGKVESAKVHIVNLPKGKTVSSPEEAHQGQITYHIKNEVCDLAGFFSTEHKAIFTHHDTFIHVHLINASRNKMGHLDDVKFKKGAMKVFLPE